MGVVAVVVIVVVVIVVVLGIVGSMRRFYHRRILQIRSAHEISTHDFLRQRDIFWADRGHLEAILSSMAEGVVVINAQGKIEHASPHFCQLLELRSKETKHKWYWEIIWNQEINDSIKEALRLGRGLKKEITIIGPNEAFFSMQISPVRDREDRFLSLIAVFHDITELKKLERLRAEFVANVSHEFKTPLTAIKGFVETLQTSIDEDPVRAKRFLDIIHKQTLRLECLVQDLLVLASMESKEVKMHITAESMSSIITAVVALAKEMLKDKDHTLTLDVSEGLPKVLVDRQRIEQVFLNLLDNAMKFTPVHGRISIRASWVKPYVCIEIADTGVGIAPEHLARLFERFYRADKARSRDMGGTGLGLAIARQIVLAHQGKIEVESTPHVGSIFRVLLLGQV